jgi:hypothetical protein
LTGNPERKRKRGKRKKKRKGRNQKKEREFIRGFHFDKVNLKLAF